MYLPRFRSGVLAAFDFEVLSGIQSNMWLLASSSTDAATMRNEGLKSDHLDTKAHFESGGIIFVPMVLEAAGESWSTESRMM